MIASDFLDTRHEVLAGIDHWVVATVRLGDLRLLLAPDRADDGGAQRLRPLASDQAYPARRGVEENRIALGDFVDLSDEILHGQAFEHHRRGLLVRDTLRQHYQPVGRHHAHLAVGP